MSFVGLDFWRWVVRALIYPRGWNLPEDVVANPATVVNQVSLEECSEFGCPNGCEQIDYGVDENANGTLDENEIDGTAHVCHGANGPTGEDGSDGVDGSDCTVSEAECVATLSCEDGTFVSWDLPGCFCDQCGVCDSNADNNDTCPIEPPEALAQRRRNRFRLEFCGNGANR